MKKKHNEGFSLVEVLVSITVLALIVIPVCSGLILSFRMNAKTDDLMQAQLAVSSAVETLMAEGIPNDTEKTPEGEDYGVIGEVDPFPDVTIRVEKSNNTDPYYTVTVTSNDEEVSVTTYVRAVLAAAEPEEEEGAE